MNDYEPNRGGNACVLKIHAPEEDNEKPTAIQIKVIRTDWLRKNDLPALWSRPRCGQNTRQTVEPAPRQPQPFDA